MPRYKLRTLLIFAAVLPPLLAFIAIVVLQVASGPQRRKVLATRQMIYRLAAETEMETICSRKLPANGIRPLVNVLNNTGGSPEWFQDRRRNHPGIEQGVDAWGRELFVEVRDDSTVWFRSNGPNGIDEHGLGDDIQHSINCGKFVRPEPSP